MNWTSLFDAFSSSLLFTRCFFTHMTLASAVISCRRVSVCLSVKSWCSTEAAKCRIMETMLHGSPGTPVIWCWNCWQNSNGVIPNGGAKCRLGRLNAGEIAENWQLLMQSVVNWRKFIALSVHQHVHRAAVCQWLIFVYTVNHKNVTFYFWLLLWLILTDFYSFCIVLIVKKFYMQLY